MAPSAGEAIAEHAAWPGGSAAVASPLAPPDERSTHTQAMSQRWIMGTVLSVVSVLALGACGESGSAPPPSAPPAQSQSQGGGQDCGTVQVPAHEGTNVKVTGADCAVAREVVMGAAGQGRAAYEAAGFSCRPAEASGDDTNYSCSKGGARITFLYGAV